MVDGSQMGPKNKTGHDDSLQAAASLSLHFL